jgi:hypothetical protein
MSQYVGLAHRSAIERSVCVLGEGSRKEEEEQEEEGGRRREEQSRQVKMARQPLVPATPDCYKCRTITTHRRNHTYPMKPRRARRGRG